MKLDCKNCGQGHFIPDAQIAQAGARGLRVRCKGCRAVMAVDLAIRKDVGEDTVPGLPRLRRAAGQLAGEPELTGLRRIDQEPIPIPSMMAGERVGSLPGAKRSLTGVTLPRPKLLKKMREPRMWFAAINGKPCGPYSRREVCDLAAQGRIRGRTRMWRPGFERWVRVRTGQNESETLGWVRDVVIERKRAERAAADRARSELGINVIDLGAAGTSDRPPQRPPPLPLDATFEHLPAASSVSDTDSDVFRSPTPVLGPLKEAFSPSEHRAAYGGGKHRMKAVLLILMMVLVVVASLYTVPALLSLGTS